MLLTKAENKVKQAVLGIIDLELKKSVEFFAINELSLVSFSDPKSGKDCVSKGNVNEILEAITILADKSFKTKAL